jgi:cytochrome c oxidase subunit 2
VGKFWSIFYILVAVAAVAGAMIAAQARIWFPGASVSPLGMEIDNLFYLILVITTVTFIATHAVMAYVLWRFGSGETSRGWFIHGSHKLEVIWSIVPAGILLFIALYQMDVWARYRLKRNADPQALTHPVAEVTARQFEWRIRYPAPGKTLQPKPQPDDLYTVNDLHVPLGRPVSILLRSEDVLHSFFLPHLRVKQDAVPGSEIPVWFEVTKAGTFDLVCAELCGWGHYKMRGQLVSQSEAEYQKYLKDLTQSQFDDGVTGPKKDAAVAAADTENQGR